jgi:hypothetical protein
MNPKTPQPNARIKLHKITMPTRPVINGKHAPTYNISEILQQQLEEGIKLEKEFTARNYRDFATNPMNIKSKPE